MERERKWVKEKGGGGLDSGEKLREVRDTERERMAERGRDYREKRCGACERQLAVIPI